MPPPTGHWLFDTTELVRVQVPSFWSPPPETLWLRAWLLERTLSLRTSVARFRFRMPPPKLLPRALLSDTLVWKRIIVAPERFSMPPPPRIPVPVPFAWLRETTSCERFRTPPLRTAPP